jgi:hypothetical protein
MHDHEKNLPYASHTAPHPSQPVALCFLVFFAYNLIALLAGWSLAHLGEALQLSDRWESMCLLVPASLATALACMLLIARLTRSRRLIFATLWVCFTSAALCSTLAFLETFLRTD